MQTLNLLFIYIYIYIILINRIITVVFFFICVSFSPSQPNSAKWSMAENIDQAFALAVINVSELVAAFLSLTAETLKGTCAVFGSANSWSAQLCKNLI